MANTQISINANGTKTLATAGKYCDRNIDVNVNVPEPEQNFVIIPITLSSAYTGAAAEHTILTGNAFVKEHYADEGFFVMWIPLDTPAAAEAGVTGWGYYGNRAMIKANTTHYSVFVRSQGATSTPGYMPNTHKLTGSGYNVSFRAKSDGKLTVYRAANYTLPAGDYLLLLGLAA